MTSKSHRELVCWLAGKFYQQRGTLARALLQLCTKSTLSIQYQFKYKYTQNFGTCLLQIIYQTNHPEYQIQVKNIVHPISYKLRTLSIQYQFKYKYTWSFATCMLQTRHPNYVPNQTNYPEYQIQVKNARCILHRVPNPKYSQNTNILAAVTKRKRMLYWESTFIILNYSLIW